jgi:hypothetical protein
MSAAEHSLHAPAPDRDPVVIVRGRVVACDWCSLDGVPYTRIVPGSVHRSDDTVNLCDRCAALLAVAIKRRQRRKRKRG